MRTAWLWVVVFYLIGGAMAVAVGLLVGAGCAGAVGGVRIDDYRLIEYWRTHQDTLR